MNIFFLDNEPKKAAEYHCDKHVIKMAVEYSQILSTVLYLTNSTLNEYVYKPTHVYHPSVIWAGKSLEHWKWLWLLGHHIGNEYTGRYHKIHKSTRVLRNLPIPNKLKDLGWLMDPPKVMPVEYRVSDVVKSYRNYYLNSKNSFCTWKNKIPNWWTNNLTN